GWLAGDDVTRGAALAAALAADYEAVWMVRGGFGSARAVAAVERWLHAPTPGDRLAALAEIDALCAGPGGAA
ncbi:MAG: hypothetical protein ACKOTZ_10430, partial [Chloroflexota bacterium]